MRRTLAAVTDRFAAFEAPVLDVHVDFPLFQRLALPIPCGAGKLPGIKIPDTRMLRLMELLLHAGTKVLGWRTAAIHQAILATFHLAPHNYTLTQLRYDLRKMKAHGLLERDGRRYAYRLSEKGTGVALLFALFRAPRQGGKNAAKEANRQAADRKYRSHSGKPAALVNGRD